MKSKSFNLTKDTVEKAKVNKTYDFIGLYESAAETNVKLLSKPKTVENLDKENTHNTPDSSSSKKREVSPSKKKRKSKNEPLDISLINIDGRSIAGGKACSSPVSGDPATSTPCTSRKAHSAGPKVKSIMKNSIASADDTMDTTVFTPSKSKKRNKSVSFMLDDTEEIAMKKTKSDESVKVSKHDKIKAKYDKKNMKKIKKSQAEKENKSNVGMETEPNSHEKKVRNKDKLKTPVDGTGDSMDLQNAQPEKKKKLKHIKKSKKSEDNTEPTENDSNNNEETQNKPKKVKKKKLIKSSTSTEASEGEPASKVKKEVKPEVIAEDLENLSIGDNAHTLTNLLDDMTVVDKDKKKKNKLRKKKDKTNKGNASGSSETADLEKNQEGKEKVKWIKRKWNKDRKDPGLDVNTSVIIENLPLKIMCSYKKLLGDHFGELGEIKKIGIAEVFPTEEPKPVFTTTITFSTEAAVSKALEEDNTSFEGSRIRVKRPLPATETTLVVKCYAELTEQNISSVFTSAGKIRSIRHLVKGGKKSMVTAFIEFDGPETVERAIKMAEDCKIGGKKIHVSKYEQRTSKRKQQKKKISESENEGDSENSND